MTNTWVVIPSYHPRLAKLHRCLDSLGWPADKVVVVAGNPESERLLPGDVAERAQYISVASDAINISLWWSLGMQYALAYGATEILLLNDDCQIRRSGVRALATALYEYDLSLVGPNYRNISSGF